jgi:hypothetical protein
MNWQPWPKSDDKGLARYVLESAAEELRLAADSARLPQDPASRRALVEAIYTALIEKQITYRLEDYQREADRQRIRSPRQVLDKPRIGTCLDLAAVFCGLCLGHDLLPLLIVLKDHAFAAVSLTHNRREWQSRTRKERGLFREGVLRLERVDDLRKLLDETEGTFLPVECTGFSRSESLSDGCPEGRERKGGFLSFARATVAGREQLVSASRELDFAIDIAWLQESGYEPLLADVRPAPFAEVGAAAEISVYAGVTALRLDYSQETADIRQYYNERFIGREKEHEAVFEFARGGGKYGGAYLLVEAPGGIGKSAFMASLVQRAEEDNWDGPVPNVVYFFVRQQGGRNTPEAFLQAVNGQLLVHLGIAGGTPAALFELRAQFSQLWAAVEMAASADAPLLVLVDGLDEMARARGDIDVTIADLLPTPINHAIRVAVSSRPNPPARDQVRREHPLASAAVLTLSTFDIAGVQRLLESVIAARASQTHPDLATMLPEALAAPAHRVLNLTRGEPLFARFVCDELVRGGLTKLAALEQKPPADAEDYFLRELKALRKSAEGEVAWQVLGLLGVSRGGLTREDLAGIAKKPPRLMDPALASIERYTLGDRRLELMHARLRELVVKEFTTEERVALTESILAWCGSYGEQGWPAETPDYVLEQYAAHLAVGNNSRLFGLLDKRWMDCHRARVGTVSRFVRDVTLATDVALRGPAPAWVAAIRGTYILATLRSVAGQLPAGVIACLARFGQQQEAEGYAELVENPVKRCEAFARLATVAWERGDAGEARRLSRVASEALANKELLGELDAAFAPLCEVLVALGDADGLAAALGTFEDLDVPEDWVVGALGLVVAAYSRLGNAERVRELLQKHEARAGFLDGVADLALRRNDLALLRAIVDTGLGDRQPVRLAVVAAAHFTLGETVQASTLAAEAIAGARIKPRVEVLAQMLSRFARHGLKDEADQVRNDGLAEACASLKTPSQFSSDEASFAPALADASDAVSLAIFEAAADNSRRDSGELDEVYNSLAGSYARVGDAHAAKAAARKLENEESDGSYEGAAWESLIRGLCEAGQLDDAIQAASENSYETRVAGFGIVADALAGHPARQADAVAAMRRAISEAAGLTGELYQAETYADLAVVLAELGQGDRARVVLARADAEMEPVPLGGTTLSVVKSLVEAHARLGDWEAAEANMGLWKDELRQVVILHARAAGRVDIASQLTAELRLIADLMAAAETETREIMLAAAAVASANQESDKASEFLRRAFALAQADATWKLVGFCAVLKAYVAAGQIAEAEGVLESLKSLPEWSMLATYEFAGGTAANEQTTTSSAEAEAEEPDDDDEEDDEVFVGASDATSLAEVLHLLGHEPEAQSFARLALAMIMANQDLPGAPLGVGPSEVELVATLLATAGQLRERIDDFDKVIDGQTHSYQAVGLLAAVARAALKSGDHPLAHELLAKALKSARLGGRIACFELISGFRSVFRTLGVPDLEWVIFETCEEVDAWWQPVTT